MHKVICKYCGKKFDKDSEPFKQVGRRYAHENCQPVRLSPRENALRKEILDYIKSKKSDADFKSIAYQISAFSHKMTYDEIYLTVKYGLEIKKLTLNRGISFVSKLRDEAKDYWIFTSQKRIPKIKKEEVVIDPRQRKKKLLTMDEEE